MLMVRRANMALSIAAGRGNRKAPPEGTRAVRGRLADHPELRERAGRGGQRGTGAGAVVVHLGYQRVDMIELQFLADEGDEGDIERRPVEVALKIEQEDFQQRRAVVEGRTAAEARDAIQPLSSPADPHRINAVLQPPMLVEADIGGRIAGIAAAVLGVVPPVLNPT